MATDDRIFTAALLVIGDEILSGRTHDKNIAQVASWLQVQGIRLCEVRVVPDVIERIVEAVNALREAKHTLHRRHRSWNRFAKSLLARHRHPCAEHTRHGIRGSPDVGSHQSVGLSYTTGSNHSLILGSHV